MKCVYCEGKMSVRLNECPYCHKTISASVKQNYLLNLVRNGDEEAKKELILLTESKMYEKAKQVTKDESTAKKVLSMSYKNVFDNLDSIENTKLLSYLNSQIELNATKVVKNNKMALGLKCLLSVALGLVCGFGGTLGIKSLISGEPIEDIVEAPEDKVLASLERPSLARFMNFINPTYTVSATDYMIPYDFNGVITGGFNAETMEPLGYKFDNEEINQSLRENGFSINQRGASFFEFMLGSSFDYIPSFVSCDSALNSYHYAFEYMLMQTEKNFLYNAVNSMTQEMYAQSLMYAEELAGTEWETAAIRNVDYFAAILEILSPGSIQLSETAWREVDNLRSAEGSAASPVLSEGLEEEMWVDYAECRPNGYYIYNSNLSSYYIAMKYYGRMGLYQHMDDLNRSALLMTKMLAEDEYANELWEEVYAVTSFFAGESDDIGYCDYYPVMEYAYGEDFELSDLVGNDKAFEKYNDNIKNLKSPDLYSNENDKGFRLMGSRFTFDAHILFEAYDGNTRMFPSGLDVPAALGSDLALSITHNQGASNYVEYDSVIEKYREETSGYNQKEWNKNLNNSFIYALKPLLDTDKEGYPMFMRNDAWNRKSLATFMSSWTELKHAEEVYTDFSGYKGEGVDYGIIPVDDRGYVEPQPEVYARLSSIAQALIDGLSYYHMIGNEDIEFLLKMKDFTTKLQIISEKELRDELLTTEEYNYIRSIGTKLSESSWKFFNARNRLVPLTTREDEYEFVYEFSELITSIANNDLYKLYSAIGSINEIYVIVPVEGVLRLCVGGVYSYYEFTEDKSTPMNDFIWWKQSRYSPLPDWEYHPIINGTPYYFSYYD